MEVDVSQAVKDTENSMRDFVAVILEKELGGDWMANCGITAERLKQWQERKAVEQKRQEGGVAEPRLIYYADFYDLKTILKKNWTRFAPALGDWRTMEVYLEQLELVRDPDAHGRELLPHQKNLAAGIAGEIRTRLIRYRSKLETKEDYFPRIESARDSLGNIWTAGMGGPAGISTKTVLRPGDLIDYVVTASDPMGEQLEFQMLTGDAQVAIPWQGENTLSLKIRDQHVSSPFLVMLQIKSPRKHHAAGSCDGWVEFYYTVLPPKS